MKTLLKRVKNWLFGKQILLARYDFNKQVMTVCYVDETTEQFKGAGTVWDELPTMKPADLFQSGVLCEVWEYIMDYGNPYPIAHEKGEPQIAKP